MFYLILFFIGLVVGSFLNVVICRLHTREKIFLARSHCLDCKKVLAWYDLIPLVSFILTFGRCRWCGKKISWQYPLVEFFTGTLFVLVGWYVGGSISHIAMWEVEPLIFTLLFYCFFISCLIVIFVYDLKHFIISDRVIYPAIVAAFSYQVVRLLWFSDSIAQLLNILIVAGIAAGFFLALVVFSRGKWMGVGDIKLAFFMGLVLGWPNILAALILSFILGAIVGIVLIFVRKRTLKSQIPFAPFLSTATLISIFWGNQLVSWYLGFIGYY